MTDNIDISKTSASSVKGKVKLTGFSYFDGWVSELQDMVNGIAETYGADARIELTDYEGLEVWVVTAAKAREHVKNEGLRCAARMKALSETQEQKEREIYAVLHAKYGASK